MVKYIEPSLFILVIILLLFKRIRSDASGVVVHILEMHSLEAPLCMHESGAGEEVAAKIILY